MILSIVCPLITGSVYFSTDPSLFRLSARHLFNITANDITNELIIPSQQGLFTSADVEFDLCDEEDRCEFAGTFALLGGPLEMPWRFDRLFKYDVTAVFNQMHLRPDSQYHFRVRITAVNGTLLDSNLLESPSVSFVPGSYGMQLTCSFFKTVTLWGFICLDDLLTFPVDFLCLQTHKSSPEM